MGDYIIKNNNNLTMHILEIKDTHSMHELDSFLKKKKSRLHDYFLYIGIVVDIENIKNKKNIKALTFDIFNTLKKNNIIPIGIINSKGSQKKWINEELHSAVFYANSICHTNDNDQNKEKKPNIIEKNEALGVEKYFGIVRGGQRIYAKNKTLIVVGDVNVNGEVIADGDIIVLGKLDGKAIAGVGGNIGAQIFANIFNATMISIDGNYRSFEENSDAYGINKTLLIFENDLIIQTF